MGRTLNHEDVSGPSDRRERVLVYGEVLFDRFQDGAQGLGGAPFNVAWHLCGFGFRPLLISAVGADAPGREILDQMEGWGLSVRAVRSDPEHPTGHVDVRAEKGEPSFSIPANQAWDYILPEHARAHAPSAGPALIYHGTLAARSAPSRQALQVLLTEADAPVFVDVNLRDPWWTPESVHQSLDGARWAQLNLEELWTLTGTSPGDMERAASATQALRRQHGLHRLIVTCAEQGAFLVNDEDEVVFSAAKTISNVVDTVGAGDGFCAVACIGLLRGWSDDVILRRANDFAGETCRFQGATRTDIAIYDAYLRHWAELPWVTSVGGKRRQGLYIMSLSVHGLVRASGIELGRDADTGGQVSYVVDEARALVEHPDVDRVDLITRQIFDPRVGDAYAQPVENITPGARIIRLPFGPRRYLRKESLWPYLDSLLDQATRFVRSQERLPDLIHGHYADAGYVGAHLASLLGVPFVFTGHSLGRVKRGRLLADGLSEEAIEKRYRISRRIEAEEQALESADLVITSTHQEVASQYERYDHYEPERMRVIPPGVDLTRFSPHPDPWPDPPILTELKRFLEDPSRPMVLAVARADERKNFGGLIEAFANTPVLRDTANLVLVAGTRDDINDTDPAPRRVLMSILVQVDRHDLYGLVAYPKHHHPSDVPDLYRLAARSGGVFVNPALTEPFGLTLIEAAACGLPVVATDDGGPRDIIEACKHGLLVDVMDTAALGRAIADALSHPRRRARWAKNAVSKVHRTFSWRTHTRRYLKAVSEVRSGLIAGVSREAPRLPRMDRMLFAVLDDVLAGDERALAALVDLLQKHREKVGVGITTGRTTPQALETLERLGFVPPDVLISASGTEIHYGPRLIRDQSWERQIRHRWDPEGASQALAELPGLRPQKAPRTRYRLRYVLRDPSLGLSTVRERLRKAGVRATALLDRRHHLDIVPGRASPGMAVRFMSFKWNLPPTRLLVAGDPASGADLLSGDTLGVAVGCHMGELEDLIDHPRVYFASGKHGWGVLEGAAHYDFFGDIQPHDEELA